MVRGLSSAGILIAENANFSGDLINASGAVISAALGFGRPSLQQAVSGFLSNGGKIAARTGIALLNGSTITGAVIGGAWTVSGTGGAWNVRNGVMELTSGTIPAARW
jgi:hypothetical protein